MNHLSKYLKSRTTVKRAHQELDLSNRPLPEADKWGLSRFLLEKVVPIVGVHPFPLDEQLLMCSTLSYFKPDLIIEWGTHIGCSARIWYETVTHIKLNTKIHTVDLPIDAVHIENLQAPNERGRLIKGLDIQSHQGDGLTVCEQLLNSSSCKNPLFFLDGDHAYTSVRRELTGLKALCPKAVVIVHDTFYQGNESGYNCGPYEALCEFVETFKTPLHSTVLGLPGMSMTYWSL